MSLPSEPKLSTQNSTMKRPRSFICTLTISCLGLIGSITRASAATIILDWTVGSGVPDANFVGVADTRTVSSAILGITSVEVRLELSGGWNGDIYAYLNHSSGFSVLLNRPGKRTGNLIGSGSSGFTITFSDAAAADVHTSLANSGLITGTYQPDARTADPSTVLDTSPRAAFLSSFNGLSASGDWTLFVSDTEAGDESILVGWGLTINGTVPEPGCMMLMLLGIAGVTMRRRRSL